MSVQTAVRTVPAPRSAEPDLQVVPAPARATARPVGRDRPLDADERQFLLGLVVLVLALGTIIVGGLLLALEVWA